MPETSQETLKPPLRLAWRLKGCFGAEETGPRGIVYAASTDALVAVDPGGQVLWTRKGWFLSTQSLPDGNLLCSQDGRQGGLRVIDATNGAVMWSGDKAYPYRLEDPGLCMTRTDIRRGSALSRILRVATPPPKLEALWQREFVAEASPIQVGMARRDACLILDKSQSRRSPYLVLLGVRDGVERWSCELKAVGLTSPIWSLSVGATDSEFVVNVGEDGLAAFDAASGKLLWQVKKTFPGLSQMGPRGRTGVFEDRVVMVSDTLVTVLDARQGTAVVKKDLGKVLRARHKANHFTSAPVISNTHVFVGDVLGTLWALDAKTLEPVWDDRAEGTVGNLRVPSVFNGRLYIRDYTDEPRVPMHLYCWEPVASGEAAPAKSPLPKFETEGELPFEIEEVVPQRKLTKRAPYHEAGGPWTVYSCRLEGGASFCFADRVSTKTYPIRGTEAALWVESTAAGEALLSAFKDSMPHRKAKAGRAQRVKAPTVFKAIDLWSQGSRQRRKWIAQPEACELVVEWDSTTKQGRILEKDSNFRAAVLELIAGLVIL